MRALSLRSFLLVSLFGVLACQSHADAGERPTAPPPATPATPNPVDDSIAAAPQEAPAAAPAPQVAKDGAANAACAKDSDCPAGHVCESCGPQRECAPGCHTDDQCPKGERCTRVQCIRCPCPGQCFGGGK